MTRPEIESKLLPDMTDEEKADLWECLYLQSTDIVEFLEFIRTKAAHGWIHPLLCFAAHTGARRSEILRVLVSDLDFNSMTVIIREKSDRGSNAPPAVSR